MTDFTKQLFEISLEGTNFIYGTGAYGKRHGKFVLLGKASFGNKEGQMAEMKEIALERDLSELVGREVEVVEPKKD